MPGSPAIPLSLGERVVGAPLYAKRLHVVGGRVLVAPAQGAGHRGLVVWRLAVRLALRLLRLRGLLETTHISPHGILPEAQFTGWWLVGRTVARWPGGGSLAAFGISTVLQRLLVQCL